MVPWKLISAFQPGAAPLWTIFHHVFTWSCDVLLTMFQHVGKWILVSVLIISPPFHHHFTTISPPFHHHSTQIGPRRHGTRSRRRPGLVRWQGPGEATHPADEVMQLLGGCFLVDHCHHLSGRYVYIYIYTYIYIYIYNTNININIIYIYIYINTIIYIYIYQMRQRYLGNFRDMNIPDIKMTVDIVRSGLRCN